MYFINEQAIKLDVDPTLYYRDYEKGIEELMTVKCAYCGKERKYQAGEMIFKHNHYKFCSYTCRARWRKENPNKRAYNTIDRAVQDIDINVTEE
jgi:endogenous inhibitor of DNA gyrase (YacG/DUF329 family)